MELGFVKGFCYGVSVTSVIYILAYGRAEKGFKRQIRSLAWKSTMATNALGEGLAKTLTYGDFTMAPDGLIEQITTDLTFTDMALKEED